MHFLFVDFLTLNNNYIIVVLRQSSQPENRNTSQWRFYYVRISYRLQVSFLHVM